MKNWHRVYYIWWSTIKFNIVYSRLDIIESSWLRLSRWQLTVQASACTVISSSIWLCNRSFVYQWPRSMSSCHRLHAMHNNEEEEVKKDDLCWVRWRRMTCVELLCVKKIRCDLHYYTIYCCQVLFKQWMRTRLVMCKYTSWMFNIRFAWFKYPCALFKYTM